jgi:hypothetical protein
VNLSLISGLSNPMDLIVVVPEPSPINLGLLGLALCFRRQVLRRVS